MCPALTGAVAEMRPWASHEDVLLREAYANGGIRAARAALPERSTSAIYHRAIRKGIKRRRQWTAEDDRRLRFLWDGEYSLREVAAKLRRTEATVYWRADKVGLHRGVPIGWEYLTTAATRSGYRTVQLRAILAWAGVAVRRALARPTKRRGRGKFRPTWIVWPADVDAALERWLQTEPVETAARRVGVCGETLARWLRAAGVEKPSGRRKSHWRVSTEDIDRAVAVRVVSLGDG